MLKKEAHDLNTAKTQVAVENGAAMKCAVSKGLGMERYQCLNPGQKVTPKHHILCEGSFV
jgi:hypothetical protein